jgi:hypothetical protein
MGRSSRAAVGVAALLFAATFPFELAAEPKITGLFGIAIGEDVFNNSVVGDRKIIDAGEQSLVWQFRVEPIHGFPDLDNYYVRYNPRDRSIYHIFGESHPIPVSECPAMLQAAIDFLRGTFPRHPYDWDGVSTFIIGPLWPGESEIIGECFAGENRLRVSVINSMRWRRHQIENRGRTK